MVEGGCVCGAIRIKSTGEIKAKVRTEYLSVAGPNTLSSSSLKQNGLGPLPLS